MLDPVKLNSQRIFALGWGTLIGLLGGLIGLGGAEFRLPVLVGFFRYLILRAIIVNLMVSLVTVTFSLVFRSGLTTPAVIWSSWPIILNLLAGSLIGSFVGPHLATRIQPSALRQTVGLFLIALSLVLIGHDVVFRNYGLQLPILMKTILGVILGVAIGLVSSLLGVAGGEMIIPTIMILFGQEIKVAGSLSLVISMPTIVVGLARYARYGRLREVAPYRPVIFWMAVGSIFGALVGSVLLRYAPSAWLQVLLGGILMVSAFRMLHHHDQPTA